MNLFRRLAADPNPLLAAYTAATGQPAEVAVAAEPARTPASSAYDVYVLLGVLADNPGVLGPHTPGLPSPIGDPQ